MSDAEIIEVPIVDLDTIYLTYDEPQREKFWIEIRSRIPWAKRVDGIKGSDAAHKAAADISDTERFILIDGDNMPDFSFWDKSLILTPENSQAQFRWRARNNINGLYYGNGGLSSWTREFVWNMKTHENSAGDDATCIEFCFDYLYWSMNDCHSTTFPHYSPQQAWRAGFREGVKLCTRSGRVNREAQHFTNWVWPSNLRTLYSWWTLGADVENGIYATWGARWGTHYLMLQNWDYVQVQDFSYLDRLWEQHQHDDIAVINNVTCELNEKLNLDIRDIESKTSQFIKAHYLPTWKNQGIMKRETYE